YTYRLVDDEGIPLPNFNLSAGYMSSGLGDSRIENLEPVRTGDDGIFSLRAPAHEFQHAVAATGGALFRIKPIDDQHAQTLRYDRWANTYAFRPNNSQSAPMDLIVRTNQVSATLHLRNRPTYPEEWRHTASIKFDEGHQTAS